MVKHKLVMVIHTYIQQNRWNVYRTHIHSSLYYEPMWLKIQTGQQVSVDIYYVVFKQKSAEECVVFLEKYIYGPVENRLKRTA